MYLCCTASVVVSGTGYGNKMSVGQSPMLHIVYVWKWLQWYVKWEYMEATHSYCLWRHSCSLCCLGPDMKPFCGGFITATLASIVLCDVSHHPFNRQSIKNISWWFCALIFVDLRYFIVELRPSPNNGLWYVKTHTSVSKNKFGPP